MKKWSNKPSKNKTRIQLHNLGEDCCTLVTQESFNLDNDKLLFLVL